jgi:hypothetical protein
MREKEIERSRFGVSLNLSADGRFDILAHCGLNTGNTSVINKMEAYVTNYINVKQPTTEVTN